MRLLVRLLALLLAITGLSLGHAARQMQVACKCTPELTLNPDEGCLCPDIILTNITPSRIGRCTKVGANCALPTVVTCKVEGTISESGAGCSGGFVDEPFLLTANCNPNFDVQVQQGFNCTGGGGTHFVQLSCETCH